MVSPKQKHTGGKKDELDRPWVPGDAIPVPEAVHKGADSGWALWDEISKQHEARFAETAPMPDPTLSSDFVEELLEPSTNAAVRANFARLNNLGLGNPGLTIEAMMRDMLRPMLKEWLDEHLPTMVERMVEREIARVSRGIE